MMIEAILLRINRDAPSGRRDAPVDRKLPTRSGIGAAAISAIGSTGEASPPRPPAGGTSRLQLAGLRRLAGSGGALVRFDRNGR